MGERTDEWGLSGWPTRGVFDLGLASLIAARELFEAVKVGDTAWSRRHCFLAAEGAANAFTALWPQVFEVSVPYIKPTAAREAYVAYRAALRRLANDVFDRRVTLEEVREMECYRLLASLCQEGVA